MKKLSFSRWNSFIYFYFKLADKMLLKVVDIFSLGEKLETQMNKVRLFLEAKTINQGRVLQSVTTYDLTKKKYYF